MSREIIITVTDQAFVLLEARAKQTHAHLTVEEYAKSAIAGHLYESLVLEKKFATARAAVALLDG